MDGSQPRETAIAESLKHLSLPDLRRTTTNFQKQIPRELKSINLTGAYGFLDFLKFIKFINNEFDPLLREWQKRQTDGRCWDPKIDGPIINWLTGRSGLSDEEENRLNKLRRAQTAEKFEDGTKWEKETHGEELAKLGRLSRLLEKSGLPYEMVKFILNQEGSLRNLYQELTKKQRDNTLTEEERQILAFFNQKIYPWLTNER